MVFFWSVNFVLFFAAPLNFLFSCSLHFSHLTRYEGTRHASENTKFISFFPFFPTSLYASSKVVLIALPKILLIHYLFHFSVVICFHNLSTYLPGSLIYHAISLSHLYLSPIALYNTQAKRWHTFKAKL